MSSFNEVKEINFSFLGLQHNAGIRGSYGATKRRNSCPLAALLMAATYRRT